MRTVVFSDTHFTNRFNQVQCDYIVKLVESVDKVIINGDFWDGYLTSFDAFLEAWQPLLAALAQKDTIYILGNHDSTNFTDERARQFAQVVDDEYALVIGKRTYHVTHGHHHSREFDVKHPRLTKFFGWMYPLYPVARSAPIVGGWLNNLDNQVKKQLELELLGFARAHYTPNHWQVFGHSHLPLELPSAGYLNPGSFTLTTARYIVIEDSGHQLVAEHIPAPLSRQQ